MSQGPRAGREPKWPAAPATGHFVEEVRGFCPMRSLAPAAARSKSRPAVPAGANRPVVAGLRAVAGVGGRPASRPMRVQGPVVRGYPGGS